MHTDFYAAYTLQWGAVSPGARALQLGVIATRGPLPKSKLEVCVCPTKSLHQVLKYRALVILFHCADGMGPPLTTHMSDADWHAWHTRLPA